MCNFLKNLFGGNKSSSNISFDPFPWSMYGQNVHHQINIDQARRLLRYNGPWIRLNVWTSEIVEDNWSIKNNINSILNAASKEGITPNLTFVLSGTDDRPEVQNSQNHLTPNLNIEDLSNRYYNCANKFAKELNNMNLHNVIIESWNEPDHEVYGKGIPGNFGSNEWKENLAKMNNKFAEGVKDGSGNIFTAFCSFMSMNNSKFDVCSDVWRMSHSGFDYFNVHMYDDSPNEILNWSKKMKEVIVDRPVIITEHGYQNNTKNITLYRQQAYAFKDAFGDLLKGVMGYVAYSDHHPWVVDFDGMENMSWEITHNDKPNKI